MWCLPLWTRQGHMKEKPQCTNGTTKAMSGGIADTTLSSYRNIGKKQSLARLQSIEGSLPPPLLQNGACHFCGTRLLSEAPSGIGIRPTSGQTCGLTFRASPVWDIAPSRGRVGLALLQRYSFRSRAPHRPHVSISEALPSALAS